MNCFTVRWDNDKCPFAMLVLTKQNTTQHELACKRSKDPFSDVIPILVTSILNSQKHDNVFPLEILVSHPIFRYLYYLVLAFDVKILDFGPSKAGPRRSMFRAAWWCASCWRRRMESPCDAKSWRTWIRWNKKRLGKWSLLESHLFVVWIQSNLLIRHFSM